MCPPPQATQSLAVTARGCTHISVMVSGRLAGMAVSPLPRQSTMPLLQVHMAGQEPEDKLQSWTRAGSVCPAREAASMGVAKSWAGRVDGSTPRKGPR